MVKPSSSFAISHKPRERNLIARIERVSIDKIARAFSGHKATAVTRWWKDARLAVTEAEEDASLPNSCVGSLAQKARRILHRGHHTVMPNWMCRRVVITYCNLRFGAWKVFDPIG